MKETFILLLALIYCQELCSTTNQSSEEVYPAIHEQNGTPLYFGLMLSLSGDDQSSGALAGVQAALDEINSRDDLLPGYSLHYALMDSKCNRTAALGGLFTQLHSSRQKIAVIGSGCSLATEATAEVSHYYNVPQISCASSSDELSNRVRFPYYFQLLPSEVNLARVFYSIIKEYGWRRVALIVQNEYRYRATMDVLKELLTRSNVSLSEIFFNINEMDAAVFDSESRIFVIAMDSKRARKLICLAHTLGLKYPKHLFLTYGSYESQWWSIEDNVDDQCSPKDRAEVLQFSLAALHYPLPEESLLTTVKVNTDFEFGYSCRDAVSTLAFALNNTIKELGQNFTVNIQFNDLVSSEDNLKVIKKHLDATNFKGVSGPVHFDENGIRYVTKTQVLQYRTTYIDGTPIVSEEGNQSVGIDRRLRLMTLALLEKNVNQSMLEFLVDGRNSVWPTYIPIDGLPRTEIVTVSIPVAVIFIFMEICGLAFAIVCLLFNFIFRNKKVIRLSSPNLNYILIFGVASVYVAGAVFTIPSNDPKVLPGLCIVRAWLIAIGYSCGFGTNIAKLWRVYIIFKKPQTAQTKNGIQDWHLMIFVSILVLVDVILLIFYTLLEGLLDNFGVLQVPNKEDLSSTSGELAITTLYYIYLCSTRPWIRPLFLGLLYGYKCVLQIGALYLAFQIRKVKIKGLNDAKYITMMVYVVTLVLIISLVSTFILTNYVNIYAVVYSVGLAISASFILGFTFIPKMVLLYKDPKGERVFSDNNGEIGQVTMLDGTPLSSENDVDGLKKKIKHLETMINEYKKMTGVDTIAQRGRSSSLLDIRYNHNGLRQQWRKAVQSRRVSVDILSSSSVLPENVVDSAHITAEP